MVNRRARNGGRAIDRALASLAGHGFIVTLVRPGTVAKALALLREHGPRVGCIVIGGGDGTVSRLLPALIALRKPFGILPLGTANDFARSLEIPLDPVRAAETIAAGRTRKVDVAFLDDRPFVNVAHLGIGTNVARAHKGRAKQILGAAAYPLRLARAFQQTRPTRVRIVTDGGRTHEVTCVELAVGPGKFYGAGLCLAAAAEPDDGLLRLNAIAPRGAAAWAALLPAIVAGRIAGAEGTLCLQGKRFRIEPSRRRVANIDGELAGAFPATVTIRPRLLTVFAP